MSLSVEISVPEQQEKANHFDKRVDTIITALLSQLSQQAPGKIPSLESLAASLNLSPSYLRHIIKEQTGASFNRHIKILRMRRARKLLQETCWMVKQVMMEVGITDHSHFAKDYKKEFGESPTETRCKGLAARTKTLQCEHSQSLAVHSRNADRNTYDKTNACAHSKAK